MDANSTSTERADAWAREEWNQFGREPRPGDLLDRHLSRTSVRRHEDPMAQLQIAILRNHLDLLHEALQDEHVDSLVARRVIERVMLGATPNPVDVQQRITMNEQVSELVRNRPLPELLIVEPRT